MLHAATIFLSAFLLFQVQPLIAKRILPWFGGTAAVWIACLLFFQVALLMGYAYAHWLAHGVPPRARTAGHLLLLGVSLFVLPIIPGEAWRPSGNENPLPRVMCVLGATVGLPYFLLASTSPLVQAWYAQRSEASPYRFFAVSNAGSLLGLLSYPLLLEPLLTARRQALLWSAAYAVAVILCIALTLRHAGAALARPPAASASPREINRLEAGVTQLFWLALPAVSAALLFAVTNHITQNVAAVPLLWVVPLALYLLSFVLCFGPASFYSRRWMLQLLAVTLGAMAYVLHPDFANANLRVLLAVYCGGLFIACLACHGELARLKPPPAQLTRFYLFVSLGGALGGLYVGGVAPLIHTGYHELPLGIAGCAVVILAVLYFDPESCLHHARWSFAWLGVAGLLGVLIVGLWNNVRASAGDAKMRARNFYGVLRVIEYAPGGTPIRKLMHGSIDHGLQFTAPPRRREPTAYYVPTSGIALAIREAQARGAVRVGVIGLGAGSLAAYTRAGDAFRFYEINPQVIQLAQAEFTFLGDAPPGSTEVIAGDARLSLEREEPQQFDVLAVDAFSGDAIPVHLLTREAVTLYFRQLKPGGVLALHVSNRYLNLQPVAEGVLRSLGKRAALIESAANDETGLYRAFWVVSSDREEFFAGEVSRAGKPLPRRDALRPWTDDYSNLIRVLK